MCFPSMARSVQSKEEEVKAAKAKKDAAVELTKGANQKMAAANEGVRLLEDTCQNTQLEVQALKVHIAAVLVEDIEAPKVGSSVQSVKAQACTLNKFAYGCRNTWCSPTM